MTRRARKEQEYGLSPLLPVVPHAVALAGVIQDGAAKGQFSTVSVTSWNEGLLSGKPPVVAIALGHAKDGRHMAVEVHLQGAKVVGGVVLAAHERHDVVVRAWEQCAWARLSEQRDYNEFELTANERDSRGVRLEDFAHGSALAMPQHGRQFAVLAMDLEGGTATEPRVLLAKGDKLTAWGTLAAWAALNLLPRRRK